MTKSFLPPPEVMATYPAPNYINPDTRGRYTIITAVVCGILSVIFVVLRLTARLKIKKGLGWDDFWIIFGLIFGICFYLNIVLGTKLWGWQYHIWDLPPRLYKSAAIIEITAVIFFLLSTSGIRMSLLSFYLHLIKDAGSKAWKKAIYGFVALTVVLSLAFGFPAIFRCTPLSAYWTYPMPENVHCFDDSVLTLVGGCLVVVADLCTMLLPLPVILRFNMPIRQRISVAILLSLGLVVTFVSTARTVYLWHSLIGTYDITWESHPLLICGSIEVLLSIICACLPSIRPLYEKFCNNLSNRRAGFRTFPNKTIDSTACETQIYKSRKTPTALSLNLSNSDFQTNGPMYPLATLTSINGRMATLVEEQPETPSSWTSNGKGSSGGWLSGKSSGATSPVSPMSARSLGGARSPTSPVSPITPNSVESYQVQIEEADLELGLERQTSADSTGITVVKSVNVRYSGV